MDGQSDGNAKGKTNECRVDFCCHCTSYIGIYSHVYGITYHLVSSSSINIHICNNKKSLTGCLDLNNNNNCTNTGVMKYSVPQNQDSFLIEIQRKNDNQYLNAFILNLFIEVTKRWPLLLHHNKRITSTISSYN